MDIARVYVVEDEPLIAEMIIVSLKKEGFEVVGAADNIKDAFYEIDDLQPDLVFLDITLGDEQLGIELGKKLSDKTEIPFIYLTSHSDKDTVQRANGTNPAGYLLKPFKSKDLKVAVDLALMNKEESTETEKLDIFFVKHNKKWLKIKPEEIKFLKADDTYTEVHTAEERYVISQSLKKLEDKLNLNLFKRVHRSYIVNIQEIESIEDDLVIINKSKGKELIPIGKTYKRDLMAVLNFL